MELSGFYGKNPKSTLEAVNITKSKFYNNIQEIIKESDILFITTPDDIISTIDNELLKFDLKNKSVCHTSGSLKSNVLCNAKHSGALIYSIHPIFAFSNKNMNLEEFEKTYFSVEGDIFENSIVLRLLKALGNNFFIRDKETSSTYHLANVFVSNLILSLLEIGISYFKTLGLSEEEALRAVKPLINGNIESIYSKGFVNSLTGPVLRGDIKTIEKHLSVLKDDDKKLYSLLSLNLLKLVALKNSEDLNTKEKEYSHSSVVNNEDILKNFLRSSKNHLEIYRILGGIE